jgi:hypothetical protein
MQRAVMGDPILAIATLGDIIGSENHTRHGRTAVAARGRVIVHLGEWGTELFEGGLNRYKPPPLASRLMPTATEEFLSRICRHSFLSLWSHPHPHRNTTPVAHELCDVLVVFGNDIILFSDKSIAFPAHDNVDVAWGRWYRSAVRDSAKQLYRCNAVASRVS